MHVAFDDEGRFADFAYLYLLGRQAQLAGQRLELKASPTVIGELAVELKPGEAFDRLPREVLNCVRADTGLTEEELVAGANKGNPERHPEVQDVVHERIDLPDADPDAEAPKTKRKCRTKAEIAADEVAEAARQDTDGTVLEAPEPEAGELPVGFVPQLEASDVKVVESEASNPVEPAATAGDYPAELVESLKAQAELFEADRTAHLKEGREAISKHGYGKYLATIKGLGLESAIQTYSDEQVKLHRAAIAHLMAS